MENSILGWNESHPLHLTYDRLWSELVPHHGEAPTLEGEIIRSAGRMVYEWCNNGNINAAEAKWETTEEDCHYCDGMGYFRGDEEDEDCSECGGDGVIYEDELAGIEITEFYQGFIDTLSKVPTITGEDLHALVNLICDANLHYNYKYDEREAKIYNTVTQKAVEWVSQQLAQQTA